MERTALKIIVSPLYFGQSPEIDWKHFRQIILSQKSVKTLLLICNN